MSEHTCTETCERRGTLFPHWLRSAAECDGSCGCDECRADWLQHMKENPERGRSATVDPFARFDRRRTEDDRRRTETARLHRQHDEEKLVRMTTRLGAGERCGECNGCIYGFLCTGLQAAGDLRDSLRRRDKSNTRRNG